MDKNQHISKTMGHRIVTLIKKSMYTHVMNHGTKCNLNSADAINNDISQTETVGLKELILTYSPILFPMGTKCDLDLPDHSANALKW